MSRQTMHKKVCVIGAGASGLCTIKELKERGHTVQCFEKYDREGGIFYYSPHKGGAYDSTILTISNYHMAFSDFPPSSGEGRHFWTKAEYADYLLAYGRKFNLFEHIQFNTEVLSVAKGQQLNYRVKRKTAQGEIQEQEFDSIAICVGNNNHPNTPTFQGQESFEGQIIHSYNYKNALPFTQQKVLIVGLGETGADVAHEISNVAESCMVSIRHYPSLVKRWYDSHTSDINTARSFYCLDVDTLNQLTQEIIYKSISETQDPERRLLREWNSKTGRFFSQFLTKNTVFLQDIAEGRLQYNVGGIERLEGKKVIFKDQQTFEADVIVCCTGYQDRFDFIDPDLRPEGVNNVRTLYKHVIHPELGENFAFIGFARPASGGVPAAAEMQARYFALLQSGERQLPDQETLKRITQTENMAEEKIFSDTPNVKSLVYWSDYMDGLAKLVGCEPNLFTLDPILSFKLWFGTQFAYQYRLRGPGAKPELAKQVLKNLSTGSQGLMSRKVLMSLMLLKKQFQALLPS
jgi:dimethylaniline monooxygenase (N-oxide forming)